MNLPSAPPQRSSNHVLPVVLEISDSTSTGNKPPKFDAVWSVLIAPDDHLRGEHACLAALASALASLAREESETEMQEVIAELRQRDTHIANHLLLALYSGGAARYANETCMMFCDEPWRFHCGFSGSEYWCARETIQAVCEHCTGESRKKLETAILQYVPPPDCCKKCGNLLQLRHKPSA